MSFFPDTRSGVPPELKFVPQTHTDDVILHKQLKFYKPYTSRTEFKAKDDIRFKITGDKSIDLRTFALNLSVAIRKTEDGSKPDFGGSEGFWDHLPENTEKDQLKNISLLHLHNYIGSIFRNLKIRFNDTVLIEEIDHYNRLRWLLAKPTVDTGYMNSAWGNMEGYKPCLNSFQGHTTNLIDNTQTVILKKMPNRDLASRSAYEILSRVEMVKKGTIFNQYTIRLDLSGFMGRWPKILFLPCVGSIDIELRLEDKEKIMNNFDEELNKPSEYIVKNVYASAEEFDLSQAYLGSLKNVLATSGLTCEFDSYLTYPFILKTNDQTQSVRLWRRLTSLKTIYFGIYRENTVIEEEGKRQDVLSRFDNAGLESYQIYLDGRPMSARPITTTSQSYDDAYNSDLGSENSEATFELMKALRHHGNVKNSPFYDLVDQHSMGHNNVYNTVDGSDFKAAADYHARPFCVYGVDLEKSNMLSGTGLSNELCIQLKFRAGFPLENYTHHMYVFLHYDKRVTIHSGLRITELE